MNFQKQNMQKWLFHVLKAMINCFLFRACLIKILKQLHLSKRCYLCSEKGLIKQTIYILKLEICLCYTYIYEPGPYLTTEGRTQDCQITTFGKKGVEVFPSQLICGQCFVISNHICSTMDANNFNSI